MTSRSSGTKSNYVKFRVTDDFKDELLRLKDSTPGCKNMELQQFIVRLIELGIEEEKRMAERKTDQTDPGNPKESAM